MYIRAQRAMGVWGKFKDKRRIRVGQRRARGGGRVREGWGHSEMLRRKGSVRFSGLLD